MLPHTENELELELELEGEVRVLVVAELTNGIELADIIRAVRRGIKRIEPSIALQIAEHASYQSLTPRQIEVLQLVSGGHSNKLVAKKLMISEETAKTHVKSIMEKLHARDRTHAVALGLRRGIIQL